MERLIVLIGRHRRAGLCSDETEWSGGGRKRRDAVATRFRSLSSRPARPIVPKGHYRDH